MSRSTAGLLAWLAVGALVAFGLISVLTANPAYILWSVVPLVMVIFYFVVAVRGETLGHAKRSRDGQIAERKAATRKTDPAAAG